MRLVRFRDETGGERCLSCGLRREQHLAGWHGSALGWSRPWLPEYACSGWLEYFRGTK